MRFFLGLTLGLALSTPVFAMGDSPSDSKFEERVRKIHDRAIVIDTHVDIPFNYATDEVDPGQRGTQQVDLPKMREGGMDAAFLVVFVPQTKRSPENYAIAKEQALTKFAAIRRLTANLYPDEIGLAVSARDVRRNHKAGKLSALIGIENGYVIGTDPELVRLYYDLGARYMSLTHNGQNDLADSCCALPGERAVTSEFGGLSSLGEETVKIMNDVGMMVDVAHADKQTVLDIAAVSTAPIISSHHALRAFVDIPRNLDDEALLAVKQTNGVVQIVAFDTYLKPVDPAKLKARADLAKEFGIDSFAAFLALEGERKAEYMARRNAFDETWPRASVETLVDHIDYTVELLGVDHVGIVSDFEGGGGIDGWDDASETLSVTAELVARGYSESDIKKIWGGNILRVMEDVADVAAKR